MASLGDDSDETRNLLTLARDGNADAAAELFARHRPYLLRLTELRLDARLRSRVDPSDVVQEAQMEANRRLQAYLQQPPLPFRLWLRQITYDRLIMLHRRHVRAGQRSVDREMALPDHSSLLLARALVVSGSSPSEEAVRRELAERVRHALDALPDREREVVLLRNLEGLTNLEVARLLGVDPATSSRQYGRAVIRLREVLQREQE